MALLKSTDSTLVTGTTTDSSGLFQLEIKERGNFLILTTSVGYRKHYSDIITITPEMATFNAGVLVSESGSQLKDVQVVVEKPFMEHKLDRTVFNIENSIISAGNNALEILRKLPGVTVDNNDAIAVRGKAGILVMVDGRNTYMSAADVANYLRGLNASQIEKIEVITNPSAKYDASGNAIINIILKKDKNLGLNAQYTISYRQSLFSGGSTNINVNYRTRKFNFYGFYNYGKGENQSVMDQKTIYNNTGVAPLTFADHTVNHFDGNYHTGRLGIDYEPNKRSTLGVVSEFNLNYQSRTLLDNTSIYNARPTPDSLLVRNGSATSFSSRITGNINYTFKIDSSGREFSASGDYAVFTDSNTNTDITTYTYESASFQHDPSALKFSLPGTLNIFSAKADYVHPLGVNNKLEGGVKGSLVNSDNNALYWNVVSGSDIPDMGKTNHFLFSENIYAAYLNFSRTFNSKLEGQFGLRDENTQSTGTQTLTDSTVKRNYNNLFPSAFLSWKVDSGNTLNLSYSRRIDRPDYGSLNPFSFYISPYNYYVGNPFLHPMISDNFEFSHVFKGILTTSLGYLNMQDVITESVHQNDVSHVTYRTVNNLSSYEAYNLLVATTLQPTSWWTSTSSVNAFHDHYYGAYEGGAYSKKGYTAYLNLGNSFHLKKDWGGEINFQYRSENIDGLMINAPIYQMDIGLRKRFAQGKGTLSLNCTDVLWSSRTTNTMVFQNINYYGVRYEDSRRLRIAFTWKFGRSQYQREEKSKSAEEELKRVKKS